jgi:hypothetical protein
MKLPRFLGLVDLAVLVVAAVALLIPQRPLLAREAAKGSEADRFALAAAEARVLVEPATGAAVAELARRLGGAQFFDWAVESAIAGAARAGGAPDQWRALQAASVALVDRLAARPALELARQALAQCERAGAACPEAEATRLALYERQLAAGVESGIDPRTDPAGFRRASERGMRAVRLAPARGAP